MVRARCRHGMPRGGCDLKRRRVATARARASPRPQALIQISLLTPAHPSPKVRSGSPPIEPGVTHMSTTKIIAVVGATGAQGGGLARAILADKGGEFAVRAITRKPDSGAARALAAAGAEVVAADLDDQASLERAFSGAYGAFCVTNFWEHFSPEKETAQAGNMARAAVAAGVKHAIWSTLEDTRRYMTLDDPRMPALHGKYKVPHFDAKGEADALFTAAGVPTTFLATSFYYENFIGFGMGPKPGPDGVLTVTMPMGNATLPMIAVDDIGRCALGVFKQGVTAAGKTVAIAGDRLTGTQIAAAFAKAFGKEVKYFDVPADVYRSFGFPGADDIGNMFQFKRDFEDLFSGPRDPALARVLDPALQGFEQWLAVNAAKIPLE